MDINIRKSEESDIPKLLEIYNYEVENSIATLDIEKKTEEQWKIWFYEHNKENHPLYTAVIDEKCAGYASLSNYRDKEAYKSTVELSVYIAKEYRGMGVASALMEYIIKKAKNDKETHLIVSVITDGNDASKHLHEKFGFEYCGKMSEVGKKFGVYQDIIYYDLKV